MSEIATDIRRFMPPENVRTYKGLVSGMNALVQTNRGLISGMTCFSSEYTECRRRPHLFVDDVQQIDFSETMGDGLHQLFACQIF